MKHVLGALALAAFAIMGLAGTASAAPAAPVATIAAEIQAPAIERVTYGYRPYRYRGRFYYGGYRRHYHHDRYYDSYYLRRFCYFHPYNWQCRYYGGW